MTSPKIIIIRNRPGNPDPNDGTPSVEFDVSFRFACPASLKGSRPISVNVNGTTVLSLVSATITRNGVTTTTPASMDPNVTQQEIADLNAGNTLEFFVLNAGNQIPVPDAATGDSNAWGAFRGIQDAIAAELDALDQAATAQAQGAGISWAPADTQTPPSIFAVIGVPPTEPPPAMQAVAVKEPTIPAAVKSTFGGGHTGS